MTRRKGTREATNRPPGWSPMLGVPSGIVLTLMEATSNTGFVAGVCAHARVMTPDMNSMVALIFICFARRSIALDRSEWLRRCQRGVGDSDPAGVGHPLQ